MQKELPSLRLEPGMPALVDLLLHATYNHIFDGRGVTTTPTGLLV
jgi:hypothetical protein